MKVGEGKGEIDEKLGLVFVAWEGGVGVIFR